MSRLVLSVPSISAKKPRRLVRFVFCWPSVVLASVSDAAPVDEGRVNGMVNIL